MRALSLSETPALKGLLPFVLGICTYRYTTLHSIALIGLSCGAFLFILSFINLRRQNLWWAIIRKYIFYLALSSTLVSIGYTYAGIRGVQRKQETEHIGLREQCITQMHKSQLSPEVQHLMAGMSLGYLPHNEANDSLRQDFALSGAAHLLAVSGFHLGVIILAMQWLLKPFRLHRKLYFTLLILSAWLFTAFVGMNVATQRAAIMLSLFLLSKILDRERNSINILASSLFLQLIFSPSDLFRWGLWLSYGAVMGILLFYKPFFLSIGTLKQGILRALWSSLTICLAAEVIVLPLSWHLFGYISLGFIFTSVPLTLLSVPFIWLSLIAYLCAALGGVPHFIELALEAIGQCMLYITEATSHIEPLVLEYPFPAWALLLCWGVSIGLYLRLLHNTALAALLSRFRPRHLHK